MALRSRAAIVLVLGAGATLLAGTPVHAASAGFTVLGQGDDRQAVFTYRASAGERNSITAGLDGRAVYLEDDRRVHAARGCSHQFEEGIVSSAVRCAIPAGVPLRASVFHLGDRDDHVLLDALPGIATVLGGRGDDTIEVGRSRARLKGDAGDDELHGGPYADLIDPGAGNDSAFGSGGRDRIRASGEGFDEIGCGAGRDVALLDGFDLPVRHGCERLVRSSAPRAIPQWVGEDDENLEWQVGIGCPADMPGPCLTTTTVSFRDGRPVDRLRVRVRRGRTRFVGLSFDPDSDEEASLAEHGARVTVTTFLARGSLVCRRILPAFPFEGD